MKAATTKSRILDVAQEQCQRVGFNAFSYADIATALGITKASVHHHFPTKSDLGRSLIQRYHERFARTLQEIDSHSAQSPQRCVSALMDAMASLLTGESKLCLCGMLASDFATLDADMRGALREFFLAVEQWLTGVIRAGIDSGSFTVHGPAEIVAQGIVATLQGMLMTARTFEDPARFHHVGEWLLLTLTKPLTPQTQSFL